MMYRKLFVETVKSLKEKGIIWVQRYTCISDTNRYRVVLVFSALYYVTCIVLFYVLTPTASKHEITVLRSRAIAYVLAIFSIQWIRTSNETSRTAISWTAFWEKTLANYLFNILFFHNSVTMFINIKTFYNHLLE